MPKYNRDSIHYFMTKALTDGDTDLAIYQNPDFLHEMRIVAAESILAILQKIHSEQMHAKKHHRRVKFADLINTPHPITGLNMLDYCLVAGLGNLAQQLMRHGAVSTHMQSFSRKISRTFSNEELQPEILQDVYTIVNSFIKIKRRVDDLVATTNEAAPGCVSAAQSLWTKKSNPLVWVSVGIGCAVLGPHLYPLVHHASSALILSAVGVPAIVSASQNSQASTAQTQVSEETFVKDLINSTKQIRHELQQHSVVEDHRSHTKRKHHGVKERQNNLLHHFVAETPQVKETTRQNMQFGI